MSIDISQLHDAYFEECFECLDVMESGIFGLELGMADKKAIDTVVRAAHSIKNGASTFSFKMVSDFSYIILMMLDEIRTGQHEVTEALTNLLLSGVEALRELLISVHKNSEIDYVHLADIRQQFEMMMVGDIELELLSESIIDNKLESEVNDAIAGWEIDFHPNSHFFKTGNDLVQLFGELENLGELTVKVCDDNLPPFFDLEPEDNYLSWKLTLRGYIAKADVVEIFKSVESDCKLTITPLIDNTIKQVTRVEKMVSKLEPHGEPINPIIDIEDTTTPIDNPEKKVTRVEQMVSKLEPHGELINPIIDIEDTTTPIDNTEKQVTRVEQMVSKLEPHGELINPIIGIEEEAEITSQTTTLSESTVASIQIETDKIDLLADMFSELVATQSMLSQMGENFSPEMLPKLIDGLAQLERNTNEVQESIMQIRKLPIIDGQIIRVANENYIIPLISVIETLEVKGTDMKYVSGEGELYKLADKYVPVIRLYKVFNLKPNITEIEQGLVVIVENDNQKVALFIDDLLGQQKAVIKNLETNYRGVFGVSGATILNDGMIALIIDVAEVIALYRDPSLAKMAKHNDRAA